MKLDVCTRGDSNGSTIPAPPPGLDPCPHCAGTGRGNTLGLCMRCMATGLAPMLEEVTPCT